MSSQHQTLISLASWQVWPQILAVRHINPERLILLHSMDETESKRPAGRLKKFLERTNLMAKGSIELRPVSHSDFKKVGEVLDGLERDHAQPIFNITGGNKLMASAALLWAIQREIPSFYLERGFIMTRFEVADGTIRTTTEPVNPHLTDKIDPIKLIRAQMGDAEVERNGEMLTLADNCDERVFHQVLNGNGSPREFLVVQGTADRDVKRGDRLEWLSALVILYLGVPMVRRSVRVKARSAPGISSRNPIAEFDLVFNYGGMLWLVDCKDRKTSTSLLQPFRAFAKTPTLSDLLTRIEDQLSMSEAKVIKEDILHIRSMGGLLGRVVCVRGAALPDEVLQFANANNVDVLRKDSLLEGWKARLKPNSPPTGEDLQ